MSKTDKVIRYGPYPELSFPGIAVGFLIGILLCISMSYASLMLGFSTEGAELSAILGFGILRGIMRRTSIIENNINQTLASSVNVATAGIMYTMPALYILKQLDFNPYLLGIGSIAGGLLGVAFIIPLRKHMIDFERLAFPQGIATAIILKAPGAGVWKAILFVAGMVASGLVSYIVTKTGYENLPLGDILGLPSYLNLTFFLSLMTIGMAYIAGRYGIFFGIGGLFCYLVLSPILNSVGVLPTEIQLQEMGTSVVNYMRLNLFRPLGIGMLIGGAFSGIIIAAPLVKIAILSMHRASKMKKAIAKDEMPIKILYYAVALSCAVFCVVAVYSSPEVSWLRGIAMGLLGTLWIWLAGVIVSEALGRTSWSPLSGMTLVAVTIIIFVCSGMSDTATIIASVTVGGAICVALAGAADTMHDFKSGFLVGATPRKQQIAQFASVWLGPLIVIPVMFLLNEAYGLGGDKFPAPQAQALASTINGIIGGDIPMGKYLAGMGLGAILNLTGLGSIGVTIGLGFYMPFNIVLTYMIGLVLRVISDWRLGHSFADNVGIPVASGLLVGEALVGMTFAIVQVLKGIGGVV